MLRPLLLLHLVAGTLAWAALPAAAQPALRGGEHVRIRAGDVTGHYTVVSVGTDSLTLRVAAAEPLTVAFTAFDRLDLHLGRRTRSQGALRGAGIGFLIGAMTGVAGGLLTGDGGEPFAHGVLLGFTGAVAGGAVGAVAPGDRWRRVRTLGSVELAATPRGYVVITYTR
jgi:hypothetical protein